ncbi:MAG: NAD(P)-dependent alcohol dehydrogenase, partial [Deltaproteobacteria bacterium]
IVIVGRGQGSFEFKHCALPYGATMSTTFGGSKLELMHLVALAEAGRIKPRITRYPLSEVDKVFEMLRNGEIVGRAVIVPDL